MTRGISRGLVYTSCRVADVQRHPVRSSCCTTADVAQLCPGKTIQRRIVVVGDDRLAEVGVGVRTALALLGQVLESQSEQKFPPTCLPRIGESSHDRAMLLLASSGGLLLCAVVSIFSLMCPADATLGCSAVADRS